MDSNLSQMVSSYFQPLVDRYEFRLIEKRESDGYFSMKYQTPHFVVKLENYRTDIYATVTNSVDSEREIDLFNLLDYLRCASISTEASANLGPNTDNHAGRTWTYKQTSYETQLLSISSELLSNFVAIDRFFCTGNYEDNATKVDQFMVNKYPDLFKTR